MNENEQEIKMNLRCALDDLLKIIIYLSSEEVQLYGLVLSVRLRIHH